MSDRITQKFISKPGFGTVCWAKIENVCNICLHIDIENNEKQIDQKMLLKKVDIQDQNGLIICELDGKFNHLMYILQKEYNIREKNVIPLMFPKYSYTGNLTIEFGKKYDDSFDDYFNAYLSYDQNNDEPKPQLLCGRIIDFHSNIFKFPIYYVKGMQHFKIPYSGTRFGSRYNQHSSGYLILYSETEIKNITICDNDFTDLITVKTQSPLLWEPYTSSFPIKNYYIIPLKLSAGFDYKLKYEPDIDIDMYYF